MTKQTDLERDSLDGPALEITPQMIEAGSLALWGFDRDHDLTEEIVAGVYRAMWEVAPGSLRAEHLGAGEARFSK